MNTMQQAPTQVPEMNTTQQFSTYVPKINTTRQLSQDSVFVNTTWTTLQNVLNYTMLRMWQTKDRTR